MTALVVVALCLLVAPSSQLLHVIETKLAFNEALARCVRDYGGSILSARHLSPQILNYVREKYPKEIMWLDREPTTCQTLSTADSVVVQRQSCTGNLRSLCITESPGAVDKATKFTPQQASWSYHGYRYSVLTALLTFDQAKAACIDQDKGVLAYIFDASDLNDIRGKLNPSTEVWLGLWTEQTPNKAAHYRWDIDLTPPNLLSTTWCTGQPQSTTGQCVVMKSGCWSNVACDKPTFALCKKAPSDGTSLLSHYIETPMTHAQATHRCYAFGASWALLEIRSPSDVSDVANMNLGAVQVWIGVRNMSPTQLGYNEWVYDDGALVASGYWQTGEPNAATAPEQCAMLHQNGKMNNVECHLTYSVVCKERQRLLHIYRSISYWRIPIKTSYADAKIKCAQMKAQMIEYQGGVQPSDIPTPDIHWVGYRTSAVPPTADATNGWGWESNGSPFSEQWWNPSNPKGVGQCSVNPDGSGLLDTKCNGNFLVVCMEKYVVANRIKPGEDFFHLKSVMGTNQIGSLTEAKTACASVSMQLAKLSDFLKLQKGYCTYFWLLDDDPIEQDDKYMSVDEESSKQLAMSNFGDCGSAPTSGGGVSTKLLLYSTMPSADALCYLPVATLQEAFVSQLTDSTYGSTSTKMEHGAEVEQCGRMGMDLAEINTLQLMQELLATLKRTSYWLHMENNSPVVDIGNKAEWVWHSTGKPVATGIPNFWGVDEPSTPDQCGVLFPQPGPTQGVVTTCYGTNHALCREVYHIINRFGTSHYYHVQSSMGQDKIHTLKEANTACVQHGMRLAVLQDFTDSGMGTDTWYFLDNGITPTSGNPTQYRFSGDGKNPVIATFTSILNTVAQRTDGLGADVLCEASWTNSTTYNINGGEDKQYITLPWTPAPYGPAQLQCLKRGASLVEPQSVDEITKLTSSMHSEIVTGYVHKAGSVSQNADDYIGQLHSSVPSGLWCQGEPAFDPPSHRPESCVIMSGSCLKSISCIQINTVLAVCQNNDTCLDNCKQTVNSCHEEYGTCHNNVTCVYTEKANGTVCNTPSIGGTTASGVCQEGTCIPTPTTPTSPTDNSTTPTVDIAPLPQSETPLPLPYRAMATGAATATAVASAFAGGTAGALAANTAFTLRVLDSCGRGVPPQDRLLIPIRFFSDHTFHNTYTNSLISLLVLGVVALVLHTAIMLVVWKGKTKGMWMAMALVKYPSLEYALWDFLTPALSLCSWGGIVTGHQVDEVLGGVVVCICWSFALLISIYITKLIWDGWLTTTDFTITPWYNYEPDLTTAPSMAPQMILPKYYWHGIYSDPKIASRHGFMITSIKPTYLSWLYQPINTVLLSVQTLFAVLDPKFQCHTIMGVQMGLCIGRTALLIIWRPFHCGFKNILAVIGQLIVTLTAVMHFIDAADGILTLLWIISITFMTAFTVFSLFVTYKRVKRVHWLVRYDLAVEADGQYDEYWNEEGEYSQYNYYDYDDGYYAEGYEEGYEYEGYEGAEGDEGYGYDYDPDVNY